MIRFFVLLSVAGTILGAAPARAACQASGLIDTCLDEPYAARADEESYQRLDGGSYGGRPAAAGPQKTITIGDTVVTLGQTEEKDEPWNVSNQNGEETPAREDRPKGTTDPLKTQCYADGCY